MFRKILLTTAFVVLCIGIFGAPASAQEETVPNQSNWNTNFEESFSDEYNSGNLACDGDPPSDWDYGDTYDQNQNVYPRVSAWFTNPCALTTEHVLWAFADAPGSDGQELAKETYENVTTSNQLVTNESFSADDGFVLGVDYFADYYNQGFDSEEGLIRADYEFTVSNENNINDNITVQIRMFSFEGVDETYSSFAVKQDGEELYRNRAEFPLDGNISSMYMQYNPTENNLGLIFVDQNVTYNTSRNYPFNNQIVKGENREVQSYTVPLDGIFADNTNLRFGLGANGYGESTNEINNSDSLFFEVDNIAVADDFSEDIQFPDTDSPVNGNPGDDNYEERNSIDLLVPNNMNTDDVVNYQVLINGEPTSVATVTSGNESILEANPITESLISEPGDYHQEVEVTAEYSGLTTTETITVGDATGTIDLVVPSYLDPGDTVDYTVYAHGNEELLCVPTSNNTDALTIDGNDQTMTALPSVAEPTQVEVSVSCEGLDTSETVQIDREQTDDGTDESPGTNPGEEFDRNPLVVFLELMELTSLQFLVLTGMVSSAIANVTTPYAGVAMIPIVLAMGFALGYVSLGVTFTAVIGAIAIGVNLKNTRKGVKV